MGLTNIYRFSFTASSLRLNEMILVAQATLQDRTIDYTNELGNGKEATGKRMLKEYQKRISKLTTKQLQVLAHSDYNNQRHMAFLSVCKTYGFIRDFVVEILREKLLVFDYQISEGEYISFYRRKADLHPEMESLTEKSQNKIRQVVFTILAQAGIIDSVKNKTIQPQILDTQLIDVIVKDDSQWLKVFFMSDMDIKNTITNI
ncbi:putative inner membrane protein DUF1819 [Arenibacter algicola]|uniref:Inner membrane protein DUF1819 n=1 Tax=Arenibacter algicola TaxID=616991 RepID=A0ABY3A796_9FLAO